MKIKILGWEKINARKDVSNPSWFKFKHKFFEDPDFYSFTAEERLAWVYLLCESSKKNESGEFTANMEHAHRVANIAVTAMKSAIEKLKQLRIIEVRDTRGRYVNVNEKPARLDKIREEKNREEKKELNTVPVTDKKLSASDPNLIIPSVDNNSQDTSFSNLCRTIWDSYSKSYFTRYGTSPVRNQTVNSQIKNLAKRLGAEAPDVVEFYLKHNSGFYVQRCHPIGNCLADAEALRTQWVKGKSITRNDVRQFEKSDQLRDLHEAVMKGEI